MAATTTSTPAQTLPDSWKPSQQGCLRTGDMWLWDYGSPKDNRTVLGGPSQTLSCFPSSTWDAAETFVGSACPPQYTSACHGQGADAAQAVTCCPTAYSFTCVAPSEVLSASHGSVFRCSSVWATSGPIVVTRTDLVGGSGLVVGTQTMRTNLHLYALPIIYATNVRPYAFCKPCHVPSLPRAGVGGGDYMYCGKLMCLAVPLITCWQSATTTSTVTSTVSATPQTSSSLPSTASKNSGSAATLSNGAAAGIGVGAALVAVLLAGLVWMACKRRRRRLVWPARQAAVAAPDPAHKHSGSPSKEQMAHHGSSSGGLETANAAPPQELPAATPELMGSLR